MMNAGHQDERRKRTLRAVAFQRLWALLIVYSILLGIAVLFNREVGVEVAFGVCIAIAALVTISFLSLHLFDRVMAVFSEWMEKYREQKGRRSL